MIIVFDLDDTLYKEMTFVQSGMRTVATFLAPVIGASVRSIYMKLMEAVRHERNGVFDRVLEHYGKRSQRLIKRCLAIYRGHKPAIALTPAAKRCLQRLKKYPLYVVTDGNRLVQKRKFEALGLSPLIRRCFCTYAHGRHRSKPSPYCFEKICRIEKVPHNALIYIADNPHKDFIGLKPLGFHTIRLRNGPYADLHLSPAHEADLVINSLDALDAQLIKRISTKTIA